MEIGVQAGDRPRIVSRGDEGRREVALTFDDGPSRWTAEVASVFERHGCRATFFMRGPAVEELPDCAAALAESGHELGNHLWSHGDARTLRRSELRTELRRTADAIFSATGRHADLVRPPFLKGAEEVVEAAGGCGVRAVVLASVAAPDWNGSRPDRIVDAVLGPAGPGDIVCLHDGISPDRPASETRQATVDAVARVVPALLECGLRPVTVSQLVEGGRSKARLR